MTILISYININRVKVRVAKGGHDVPSTTIRKRYHKTHRLLYNAIKLCHRSYIFDNSGKYFELIAETDGGKIGIWNPPEWFIKHVYLKVVAKIAKAKEKRNK